MQGQNQQQAYDRGITIFSPDGRLYQVEYAREAVKRGSASVGIRTPEGIVLAAERRTRSPLMERDSVEKLHKIDDHVGIASAGHVADARQLIDVSRRQSQVNQLRYGEPVGVETLTKHVTDHIQQYTQTGGARPFGVALLVGGVEHDGTPRLYETDPSGTPYEWKAVAIGGSREDIQRRLEDDYETGLSLDDGIDLALESLSEATEDGFPREGIAVSTVPTETGRYESLDQDEIGDRLEALDLLETDEAADETEGEDE